MGSHVGRDVVVEFAVGDEDQTEASLTWYVLGMMRGKSIKTSWDTVDTTADKSPAFTKTSLVTFKAVEISGDGVAYDDDVHNQQRMEQLVVDPAATEGSQPKAWFRITYPSGKKYVGPFLVNEWANDSPHAGEATWSMNAMSNGQVTFTPAP